MTKLEVLFVAPDFDGGRAVSQFKIEWDTTSAFSSINLKSQVVVAAGAVGSRQNFIIDNLQTGQVYFARVSAYNTEKGYGTSATTSPVSQVPRGLPTVPLNVVLEPAVNGLNIRWSSPTLPVGSDGVMNIDQYRVEWFQRSPSAPHFGVDHVMTVATSADDQLSGSFTLSFGSLFSLLVGEVTITAGQNFGIMKSDVTGLISLGDVLQIGDQTVVVATAAGRTFSATLLPLVAAFGGVTGTYPVYARHTTSDIAWNADAARVEAALETLPSMSDITVSRSVLSITGMVYTIVFNSALGSQTGSMFANSNLLGGTNKLVVFNNPTTGVKPLPMHQRLLWHLRRPSRLLVQNLEWYGTLKSHLIRNVASVPQLTQYLKV